MSANPTVGVENTIGAAYDDYFADFQRQDALVAADHFTVPLSRVANGRITVAATRADVEAMLTSIWASLATRRYGRSALADRTVTVLDERCAQLRARGTRYDLTDDPMEDFDVLYTLVRGADDRWRIAVITSLTGGR
ncbi:MAG: hypothetical protein OJJ54_07150 [Pseudonocardia sp.]|nr:hypothetical protein [Pseudonocardia sp.]